MAGAGGGGLLSGDLGGAAGGPSNLGKIGDAGKYIFYSFKNLWRVDGCILVMPMTVTIQYSSRGRRSVRRQYKCDI